MYIICLLIQLRINYMSQNYGRNGMHNLAELFKREKRNSKSQKEAAEFLKIDHRSVSRHMKQKNIGLDILQKYADYLQVSLSELVGQPITRQINGYVGNNLINFYGINEERPVLTGAFSGTWWWYDKKTFMIIDKNDPKGSYYNLLNFYYPWLHPTRMKDQAVGLYQPVDDENVYGGVIIRKSDNEFICRNFYDGQPRTLKLKQYARFICSYDLNELPVQIK